ncbi:MAG TPA: MaoC/PaaZ C-terminal domain-containing protein [Thermoplasmata archaeon]|nr:MaoC/PaaZ C-terminal domain-containing protein [Thermoplasmata archaeon]
MSEYPLPFSEFRPGLEFATPERRVTEEDIRAFATLSEDHNPLHEDPEFVRWTRFGTIVAHGALTFSILTGLWDRAGFMSGTVEAFAGVDELRFLHPVRAGDRLRARVRVTRTEPRSHGGLVTFENELLNDRDEVVLTCRAVALIRADRPPGPARLRPNPP